LSPGGEARAALQQASKIVIGETGGLLFCVIPQRPGGLNDDNARRWD
jgi:hypothetical protein